MKIIAQFKGLQPVYVTFEQAKLLAVKNFTIECTKIYNTLGELWNTYYGSMTNSDPDPGSKCTAPEQWLVIEWLRVEKGIWVQLEFGKDEDKIWFDWYTYSLNKNYDYTPLAHSESGVNSPQEAYSAAFDYILNNLI